MSDAGQVAIITGAVTIALAIIALVPDRRTVKEQAEKIRRLEKENQKLRETADTDEWKIRE